MPWRGLLIVVTQLVADLKLPLASVRLATYRPAGGTEEEMLVNYLWNVALCEALYPCLNALEVSLRNGIHHAAADRYRTDYWFDVPGVLKLRQPGEIQAARDELTRRNKPHTAGRIIAELRFSFWTSLLSGPYHSAFWMDRKAAILRGAFPACPPKRRIRKDIHARYNDLRFLRNRVFHFEPIWNRPDLVVEHARIKEAIGWISPALRDLVARSDRFPDVYSDARNEIEDDLRDYLGLPPRSR